MARIISALILAALIASPATAFDPQPEPPRTQTSIKMGDGSVKSMGSMKTETIRIRR
jgi:hypothetical protein